MLAEGERVPRSCGRRGGASGRPGARGFAFLYTGSCDGRRDEGDPRRADFFLIGRIDAFNRCDERNVSVLALVTWLGFRQAYVERRSNRGGRPVGLDTVAQGRAGGGLGHRLYGAADAPVRPGRGGPADVRPVGRRLRPRRPRRRPDGGSRRVADGTRRRTARGPGGDGRVPVARSTPRGAGRRISSSARWV